MKRSIALASGVAALWFGAATADAAPRPEPTLVLEPNPVAPGGRFTATVEDFCSNDAVVLVQFVVEAGEGRIEPCAPNGLAIATLTAPATPGQYDVRAETEDAILAITTLVVQEGAPGADKPLPDTGLDSTVAFTAIGGGLLGAGMVLVTTARSRRPSAV